MLSNRRRQLGLLLAVLGVLAGLIAYKSSSHPQNASAASPRILSLTLLPQPVTVGTDVMARVTVSNPSGDAVHYDYQWVKNGDVAAEAAGQTLAGHLFKKGDVIAVQVTPSNDHGAGEPVTSESITIQDSKPVVTELSVTPDPMLKGALTAAAVTSDPDGDDVVLAYQWTRNGQVIEDQTSQTLSGALIAKGDVIAVRVTPSDGQFDGTARTARAAPVGNRPPHITSSPPHDLGAGALYVYRVTAEDPDGDPVSYALVTAPDGMTIDPSGGEIRWAVTSKDIGVHTIEVGATDSQGAKMNQRFDLNIFPLQSAQNGSALSSP